MNLFHEAKKVLDKDGKVNALGPYGKQKLTGLEVSTYFRRNKVKDKQIKKAVEVALDMGGAMSVAYKEIAKFYGRKVADSKEVQTALQYANEETFREGLDELEEGQFWGQKGMAKADAAKLKKAGAVRLQKKEKGGESRITLPKGHKDIKKYMKQGYKQIEIESVEAESIWEKAARATEKKNLDEVRTILQKDIQGLNTITDIEIRFSDEKEWKRMSAMVKRELSKPEYKGLPKAYYIDDPLQIGFGHGYKSKKKINIKPIVDIVVKNTKDPQTRIKSLAESIRRGLGFSGGPGGKGPSRNLTALRKKKFDALYKKMDGGPEHQAIKKKIKNKVKADDAFHALVMKKVTNEEVAEAFSKTPKSGAEVAKMMMKSKTMKGFANKVKKMKTVTAVQLDKMLPDYISGGDIGAMFEEITEGKLGDSIIRKDFPNVWAASAKDRTILKKFHAKVDTKNYKAQKQLYNKNKKAFMSGLGKEKLSSIMKKMTVKKGPMKGWMTDEVIHSVANSVVDIQEAELDEINLKMPEKVRVQLLTLYNKAMDVPHGSPAFKGIKKEIDKINQKYAIKENTEALQKKLEFLRKQRERHDEAASGYREKAQAIRERNPNDTAGADNYDNMADKQEVMAMKQNERIRDIKDQVKKEKAKDEQVKPFFDTYRDMQEEVANITVDPRNKISKVDQQNTHAMNIHKAAQRMGLKSAMVGKNIRVKGSKKNVNDFMRVVIGKSSYGDPTEKDMSTPQIDKMLNKNLK